MRLLVKVKPSCRGDPSIPEMPVSWDDHQGQTKLWSGAGLSLRDKLCVPWMAEPEKCHGLAGLWRPGDRE